MLNEYFCGMTAVTWFDNMTIEHSFSQRIVDHWNKLPDDVVFAAVSVNITSAPSATSVDCHRRTRTQFALSY